MVIGGSRRIALANHMDDVLDALGVGFCGDMARGVPSRSVQPPADRFPVISHSPSEPRLPVPAKTAGTRPAAAVVPRRLAP
jgi:hypothetical protein